MHAQKAHEPTLTYLILLVVRTNTQVYYAEKQSGLALKVNSDL